MIKNFQNAEDVLADELFLAWYLKVDNDQIILWEQWLAANPGQQSLVNEAIAFMDNLPQQEQLITTAQTEVRLSELHKKINESATPVVSMKGSRRRWWIGAAAAVLIIISVSVFLKFSQAKSKLNTEYGVIATNHLPVVYNIFLNSNSTDALSNGWKAGSDREVWLSGEAYFKVTKTPHKSRFIVHIGDLDVIVTGTQFNVLHRDNKTSVLLSEGSVTLHTADGKELYMKPGDYVEMTDKQVERKVAKEEDILAWKENKLAFDNTSIREIAQIISNHYGVKVRLADDKIAAESITGIMPNNNLDVLLKAIEMGTDVQITRTEKEIVFSLRK
jgi:transmembrane sensor